MAELNDELRKKVESILFASGKKIDIIEIAKLCRMSHNLELIEKVLNQLKEKFDAENSSLMLMKEGTAWKLTVREKYVHIVQKIVTQTELSKTIMETLAVIAYKAPVLQSEIIKVRTNKAYDHLRDLESTGYITREKKGRTKLIKLTQQFFEYFDVPPEKIKEKFRNVEDLEKAVEIKENEAGELKQKAEGKKADAKKLGDEHKKAEETEMKNLDKKIKEKEEKLPEIDLVDEKGHKKKLKTYDSEIAEDTELEKPKSNIEVFEEKLGKLNVVELGLPAEEKKELIKESEELKKADELEQAKKEGKTKESAESEEREKKFDEKFKLYKKGEEKEKTKEAAEEPEKESEEKEEPKEEGEETGESTEEKPEKQEEPEKSKEERITTSKIAEEAAEAREKNPAKQKEGKKLFEKGVPKGVQEKIDKRVEEIVFGKEEEKQEKETEDNEEESKEETPGNY